MYLRRFGPHVHAHLMNMIVFPTERACIQVFFNRTKCGDRVPIYAVLVKSDHQIIKNQLTIRLH